MDLFADGGYVRLRSRVRGTYLHADDDGVGVSLRPLASAASALNSVWRVHLHVHQGTTFVLLHGAAYGRYIAHSFLRSPHGHRGTRAIQLDHEGHNVSNLMWRVIEVVGDEDDEGRHYVLLRRHSYNRNLRANGRHRNWLTGVTVDTNHGRLTTMMHWEVEAVPMRSVPLPFPLPAVNPGGSRWSLFRRRVGLLAEEERMIRHVRANEFGVFNRNHDGWPSFTFYGRCLFNLRTEVAIRQHDWPSNLGITICVRAGEDGRLTPLFTDLPRSHEPMDIVVLSNWSQAFEQLVYPDV